MVVVMRERIGHLDSQNIQSRQLNQLHETTQAACLLDYAKLEKTAEVLGNRQFDQLDDIKALNAELNTLSAIVNDVLLEAPNHDELWELTYYVKYFLLKNETVITKFIYLISLN